MDRITLESVRQWLGRASLGLLLLWVILAATIAVLVAAELSAPEAEPLLTAPVRWSQRS